MRQKITNSFKMDTSPLAVNHPAAGPHDGMANGMPECEKKSHSCEQAIHYFSALSTYQHKPTHSMEITGLHIRPEFTEHKRLFQKMLAFQQLINELKKKNLPVEMANSFNTDIEDLNQFAGLENDRLLMLKKKQAQMVTRLEKELKLVTINHYRDRWMLLGMSPIGMAIGIAIGIIKDNMGLLGIGLAIGMIIGMLVGASMDENAKKAGKLLQVKLR